MILDLKSLCLGNYIIYLGKVHEIYSLSFDGLNVKDSFSTHKCLIKDIKGINISPFWLSKLSFIKVDKYTWRFRDFFLHRRLSGWTTRKSDKKLIHIHEIQNLLSIRKGKNLTLLIDKYNYIINEKESSIQIENAIK